MNKADNSLKLLLNLSKVQSLIYRKFELSAHGISFSDFMILYLLNQATGCKMRRIDLAEKTGMTASGVTRMLVPMEKIGLIQREANERDARVSYAAITETGKEILRDAMVTANYKAKEIIPQTIAKNSSALMEMLEELGGDLA